MSNYEKTFLQKKLHPVHFDNLKPFFLIHVFVIFSAVRGLGVAGFTNLPTLLRSENIYYSTEFNMLAVHCYWKESQREITLPLCAWSVKHQQLPMTLRFLRFLYSKWGILENTPNDVNRRGFSLSNNLCLNLKMAVFSSTIRKIVCKWTKAYELVSSAYFYISLILPRFSNTSKRICVSLIFSCHLTTAIRESSKTYSKFSPTSPFHWHQSNIQSSFKEKRPISTFWKTAYVLNLANSSCLHLEDFIWNNI